MSGNLKKDAAKVKAKEAAAKAAVELESIGKEIAERVKIMRKYDAAANEKAGVEMKKSDDERDTITKVLLVKAKAKCKEAGKSFKAFQKEYCPDLSRSRLYAVLAIADGRKTVEQDRADTAARVRKHREEKRPLQTDVTDTPPIAPEPAPVAIVAGNDVDPDASAIAMKQKQAEAEAEAEVTTPDEAPKPELSPEEISDDELTAAKNWWRQHGPNMTDADVAKYRVFISDERQWRPRGYKKAA